MEIGRGGLTKWGGEAGQTRLDERGGGGWKGDAERRVGRVDRKRGQGESAQAEDRSGQREWVESGAKAGESGEENRWRGEVGRSGRHRDGLGNESGARSLAGCG